MRAGGEKGAFCSPKTDPCSYILFFPFADRMLLDGPHVKNKCITDEKTTSCDYVLHEWDERDRENTCSTRAQQNNTHTLQTVAFSLVFPLRVSNFLLSIDTRHCVANGPTIRSAPCAREEFYRREQGRCTARAPPCRLPWPKPRGGKPRLPGGTGPN